MTKKKSKKLGEAEEKQIDYFVERLANILIMQVEEETLKKKETKRRKKSKTP